MWDCDSTPRLTGRAPPPGFVPPPRWQPDPAWPPPPPGWQLWVPDDTVLDRPAGHAGAVGGPRDFTTGPAAWPNGAADFPSGPQDFTAGSDDFAADPHDFTGGPDFSGPGDFSTDPGDFSTDRDDFATGAAISPPDPTISPAGRESTPAGRRPRWTRSLGQGLIRRPVQFAGRPRRSGPAARPGQRVRDSRVHPGPARRHFPLSIIFAVVALRQIADSRQRGKGLAFAGLVLSIIWGAALAVYLAGQLQHASRRQSAGGGLAPVGVRGGAPGAARAAVTATRRPASSTCAPASASRTLRRTRRSSASRT